jgi:thiol-disulfide isomerase/thioredoxin
MKPAMMGVIGLVVLALFFIGMSQGNLFAKTEQGFGDYGKTNDRGTFTMYYADWCPHCQTAKPLFKSYMESGTKNINGILVKMRMIEEKQIQKGVDPDVKGYPSFLYSDASGKIVEFSGPRNAQGFDEFLKSVVLA